MKLLIIFLLIFVGCKKTEVIDIDLKCSVVARKGNDNQIIGKWKLVKAQTVFLDPRTVDYSCNQIIYAFDLNGNLTITADTADIIGQNSGSYDYTFSKSSFFEGQNEKYTIKIKQRSITCGISNGVMILDDSPLDGPILYLVRI